MTMRTPSTMSKVESHYLGFYDAAVISHHDGSRSKCRTATYLFFKSALVHPFQVLHQSTFSNVIFIPDPSGAASCDWVSEKATRSTEDSMENPSLAPTPAKLLVLASCWTFHMFDFRLKPGECETYQRLENKCLHLAVMSVFGQLSVSRSVF